MLFLPAAALCCLCSALVAMAAELVQDEVTLTKTVGQSVSFSCGGTDQCINNYVFWYQKKETETFKVIFDIDKSNCNIDKSYSTHPQLPDFSAERKQNGCNLKINRVKVDHSASYYCGCGKSGLGAIFGPGAKLYVADQQLLPPQVSVYPAASRAHLEGRSYLLCLASGMFPPEVRFIWRRQKEDGGEEELSSAEEQLELRESGRIASILVIQTSSRAKYSCSVKHEGGTVKAAAEIELPAAAASCPAERKPAELQAQAESFQSEVRVKLLCLLYSLLIVKSLVYCCGLSLLMILTNKGASTN